MAGLLSATSPAPLFAGPSTGTGALDVIEIRQLARQSARIAPIPFVELESSQARVAMTLHKAVGIAVKWHPSVREAVGSLYQQGAEIEIAESGYYPQISGGFQQGTDSSGLGTTTISASQMLYDFGKVSSQVDAARASARQSQAELLLAIDEVVRDTARAVIEVARYQTLLKLAEAQVDGMSDIAGLARKRSELGASPRSDLLEAASRVDWAQATLENYQAQHQRWNSVLANLLGSSRRFEVNQRFPAYLTQSCQQGDPESLSAVPELLVAEARRLKAQALVDQARAQGLPTLSLDPSLSHGQRQGMDAAVTLNFEMPIYEGGAIGARRSSASHALRAAEAARESALLSVRQGLYESRDQIFGFKRRLESLGMRVDSIQQTRDLYRRQYVELGNRRLTDLLSAEQQIHQARFDHEDTQADLQRLYIDCLYYTGALRTTFGLDNTRIQGVAIRQ